MTYSILRSCKPWAVWKQNRSGFIPAEENFSQQCFEFKEQHSPPYITNIRSRYVQKTKIVWLLDTFRWNILKTKMCFNGILSKMILKWWFVQDTFCCICIQLISTYEYKKLSKYEINFAKFDVSVAANVVICFILLHFFWRFNTSIFNLLQL